MTESIIITLKKDQTRADEGYGRIKNVLVCEKKLFSFRIFINFIKLMRILWSLTTWFLFIVSVVFNEIRDVLAAAKSAYNWPRKVLDE